MAHVHDVAAYVLQQCGPMSTMKLQKLVYYCQAWHLAWEEVPLFSAKIEAWANGPVVYELFKKHRGRFSVDSWPFGDPGRLAPNERESVDIVLAEYGPLTGRQLSYLTHAEDPWRQARGDRAPTAHSRAEITPDVLQDYYSAVDADDEAIPVEELNWPDWEESP